MCHCCDITKTVKSKKKDNFVRLIFGDFFCLTGETIK